MAQASKSLAFHVGKRGEVRRRVTRTFDGVSVVLSDVPIAESVEEFRKAHPAVNILGVVERQRSLKELLDDATPEEIEALGIQVKPKDAKAVKAASKQAKAEPETGKVVYPVSTGAGWWQTSDGEKTRSEAEAREWQAVLDAEKP